MAAKARDYRAEYARRIARAEAKGLSRSQARGHAKPTERPASAITGTQLRGAAKRQSEAKAARGVPAVRWSAPTELGTRHVQTKSWERFERAVLEAAAASDDILIAVYAHDINEDSPWSRNRRRGEPRTEGWVHTGRMPAAFLTAAIEENGGNIAEAVRDLFAEQGISFGQMTEYQIKQFA